MMPLLRVPTELKNLKYVAQNLPAWTSEQTNNFGDLEELYGELLGVYSRYMGHVTTHIGGVYENIRTPEQGGVIYQPETREKQQQAMAFLNRELWQTPEWLVRPEILQNIDHAGYFEKSTSPSKQTTLQPDEF